MLALVLTSLSYAQILDDRTRTYPDILQVEAGSASHPATMVGTTFAISIKEGGKTLHVIKWKSLTPAIQVFDEGTGVFKASEVGYGIIYAYVFRGTRNTTPKTPDIDVMSIPVAINPVHQLNQVTLSNVLTVGATLQVEFAAMRKATKNLGLNSSLDRIAKYEPALTLGTADPASREFKDFELAIDEAMQLRPDVALRIQSLTPDVALVSQTTLSAAESVTVRNGEPVTIYAKTTGTAKVRVSGGGLEREFSFRIIDPEIVLSHEGKARTDKEVEIGVSMRDKSSGRSVGMKNIRVVIKDPQGTTSTYNLGNSESMTTVTFTPTLSGDYTVSAQGLVETFERKAAATIPVRESVKRVNLSQTTFELIEGDFGLVRLEGLSAKNKPVKIDRSDCSCDNRGVEIQTTKDVPTLRFDPTAGPGIYPVEFKIDDEVRHLTFRVSEALELTSTTVAARSARDLFGGQVAKEFVIRELVFRNRLNEVINNPRIQNKEMIVYGNSLTANVLVGKTTGGVDPGKLKEALDNADYLMQYTPLEEQQRAFSSAKSSMSASEASSYTMDEWRLFESERRRRNHLQTVHQFFFDKEAPYPVVVMPYNPVFASELSLMKDAIEARSPLSQLEGIFRNISLFTTFASQLKGAPGDLLGRLFKASDRNPFSGPLALDNKGLVDGLIQGYLDHRKTIDSKAGKGLAAGSDVILDATLSVSAGAPVRRYLLVPRDAISTGRGRILEIVDGQIRVSYNIVSGVVQDTNAKAPGSSSNTEPGAGVRPGG